MRKLNKIIILLSLIVGFIVLVNFASALTLTGHGGVSSESEAEGVALVFGTAIKAILSLIGAGALILFIYGGYLWLTSAGQSDKINKGKTVLVWTIIAMILMLMSYVLTDFVIYALTTESARESSLPPTSSNPTPEVSPTASPSPNSQSSNLWGYCESNAECGPEEVCNFSTNNCNPADFSLTIGEPCNSSIQCINSLLAGPPPYTGKPFCKCNNMNTCYTGPASPCYTGACGTCQPKLTNGQNCEGWGEGFYLIGAPPNPSDIHVFDPTACESDYCSETSGKCEQKP